VSDGGWAAPEPENGAGTLGAGPGQPDMTSEQAAYLRGRRDAIKQMTTPRMTVFRAICGVIWAVIAILFGVGAIYNLVEQNFVQLLAGAAIAGFAGWYDYRIWTLKARRLFLII
jgi:hypothetical protein